MTTVDHDKPKGSKGGMIVNGSRGFYARLTVSYTTHIEWKTRRSKGIVGQAKILIIVGQKLELPIFSRN